MAARDVQTVALIAGKGLTLKISIIVTLVVLLGIMLLAPFASMGENEANAVAVDPCVAVVPIGTVAPPLNGSAQDEQVELATTADAVAQEMGLPGQAVLVILMTGLQESGMSNIDYGDRDSVGWLQQRPSQGWGTVEQIMDPAYSSRKFFEALQGIDGWAQMTYNDAAQAVQRSGYPEEYAKHESNARSIAATADIDLERDSGGSALPTVAPIDCPAPAGPALDGTWPPELATICPDPTNGLGCVTPRTSAIVTALRGVNSTVTASGGTSWNQITCWDPHLWNPSSDHPKGKACDLGYGPGFAAGEKLAAGDQMAAWMIENAGVYGVNYIIWQGRIWFARKGVWEPYNSGIYDTTSPSGGHFDHVHASVF